jgi:hypothetical protein
MNNFRRMRIYYFHLLFYSKFILDNLKDIKIYDKIILILDKLKSLNLIEFEKYFIFLIIRYRISIKFNY